MKDHILHNPAGETLDLSFGAGAPDRRFPDWIVVLGHSKGADRIDRPPRQRGGRLSPLA